MEFLELKRAIDEKPKLDFGSIFNNSIELFKKVWGEGVVILLLTMVTILPFYLLVLVPMASVGMRNHQLGSSST